MTAFPYRTAAILTGVTYALADWTAQSCEGRGPFGFSRLRLIRCCAVGATLLAGPGHQFPHCPLTVYGAWDTVYPVHTGGRDPPKLCAAGAAPLPRLPLLL